LIDTGFGSFDMPAENIESLEAEHGQKMIEIKLRFWTNDIAGEPGKVIRKHAWSAGVVRVERNTSHGIERTAELSARRALGRARASPIALP
jgi:hypothetical protein